jgi:hypothetical protein
MDAKIFYDSSWRGSISPTQTIGLVATTSNVDTLAILDCCFAAATTRAKFERAFQALAACGSNEISRSRAAKYISFTQRFAAASRVLQKTSARPFTSVDEIYQPLQNDRLSNASEPRLKYLGGIRPISLPFKDSHSPDVSTGLSLDS